MKRIAVIGSVNVDLVFESERIPLKGETIHGKNFSMNVGGKGANQAVAAARLGGDVTFFGSVGNDIFGEMIEKNLGKEKVATYLNSSSEASGVAEVNIFDDDNSIVVIPGANWDFTFSYLEQLKKRLDEYDIFIFQLEIEKSIVDGLVKAIRELEDKIIILNPAPAEILSQDLIESVDYITPNEHEVYQIGLRNLPIKDLLKEFPNKLLVTMGAKGVNYYDEDSHKIRFVPALSNVRVRDTTGAGDTFSGAFAFGIANGFKLNEAIQFANIAAGLSIGKLGAQTGMPTYEDVRNLFEEE